MTVGFTASSFPTGSAPAATAVIPRVDATTAATERAATPVIATPPLTPPARAATPPALPATPPPPRTPPPQTPPSRPPPPVSPPTLLPPSAGAPTVTFEAVQPLQASVDLGLIEINGVQYKMTGNNWPKKEMSESEKQALSRLLQPLLVDLGNLDNATVKCTNTGLEVTTKDRQNKEWAIPLAEKISSGIRSLRQNSTAQSPSATLSSIVQQANQSAQAVQPPPIAWGWNNCYWATILWVYLLNPHVQRAVRQSETDSVLKQLLGKNPLQLRAILNNPEIEKKALQALLLASQQPVPQDRGLSITDKVNRGIPLEAREVWAAIRNRAHLSENNQLESSEPSWSPVPSITIPSDQDNLQTFIQDRLKEHLSLPKLIDLKIEDRAQDHSSIHPPLSLSISIPSQQGPAAAPQTPPINTTYILQGLIIHTGNHYVSVVRRYDAMGIMHTFFCDNCFYEQEGEPSTNRIQELTNLEYQQLLAQRGFKVIQALYVDEREVMNECSPLIRTAPKIAIPPDEPQGATPPSPPSSYGTVHSPQPSPKAAPLPPESPPNRDQDDDDHLYWF